MTEFRCKVYSCSLSPAACAGMRSRGKARLQAVAGPVPMMACRTCEVGSAHARGELPTHWPDGTPVVRLTIVSRSSGPPPRPAQKAPRYTMTADGAARGRALARGRRAVVYQSGGLSLTVRQWAEHLGVNEAAVRARIAKYGVERLHEPRRQYPARRSA